MVTRLQEDILPPVLEAQEAINLCEEFFGSDKAKELKKVIAQASFFGGSEEDHKKNRSVVYYPDEYDITP